jgi:FKBP-type peptidyl-prolyl cis-trans isomerase SlyD
MTISNQKVVSLSYVLRTEGPEGEIVETVKAESPMVFIFGMGNLLPKFEENIAGLKVGDSFAFKLNAADAYGEAIEEAVVSVPKSAFVGEDGETNEDILFLNNVLPMMDSDGNRMEGMIIEITDDKVVMDFNHPLAGDNLYFTGSVVDLRDASEEELAHGHIHADDCGCSGGCSGCEGGSCH